MIAITVNDNGTAGRLAALVGQVKRPRAVIMAVGREGRNLLVSHFRRRDRAEPNQLGGKRSHFWLQVARSVQTPATKDSDRSVVISINHPAFAQKLRGGTIRAKRARNLAIPVSREAYGRAPRVFERETSLRLIFIKQRTNLLLASVDPTNSDRLTVQYLLTPRVTQKPDPQALPPKAEFERALVARAERVVRRLTTHGGGSAL